MMMNWAGASVKMQWSQWTSRSMAGNELFERLELLLVWDSSKSAVKILGRCMDAVC